MALPLPAGTSLKINGLDVTTTYGFYVRDVEGLEPLGPAEVLSRSIAGVGSQVVGDPLKTTRTILISGTVGSGTSTTDLNRKIAKLAAAIGRTTYGFRTVHLEFTQPGLQFEGVYAGDFSVEYVGARGVARMARVSFSVTVRRVQAETNLNELATGTLDSTLDTPIYLAPSAAKAGWPSVSVYDDAVIIIKNANATVLTAIDVIGLFQKRYEKIAATTAGTIKVSDGYYKRSNSLRWQALDTHTVKYPADDGIFKPRSLQFSIIMAVRPQFNVADAGVKTLFSCNNATDGNRTRIRLTTNALLFTVGQSPSEISATITPLNDGKMGAGSWSIIVAKCDKIANEIKLTIDNLNAVTNTLGAVVPSDENGNFFIGSKPDGTTPCESDIGEIAIIASTAIDPSNTNFGIEPNPIIENNRLRATEWLTFGTDFRPALGTAGVGRGVRKLTGTNAQLLQQNEELHIDLKRRRVFRVDLDDHDNRSAEVTNLFSGEWPSIGSFNTIVLNSTPKQASMTYRILGRNTSVE